MAGPYFFIGLLLLFGGLCWTLYYFILLLTKYKSKANFGILTVHLSVIAAVLLYVHTDRQPNETVDLATDPADVIFNRQQLSAGRQKILHLEQYLSVVHHLFPQ